MSHQGGHNHHHGDHGHDHGHQHKPAAGFRPHKSPLFWVAVGLMLLGMVVYILTLDESRVPGGGQQAPVPAAP